MNGRSFFCCLSTIVQRRWSIPWNTGLRSCRAVAEKLIASSGLPSGALIFLVYHDKKESNGKIGACFPYEVEARSIKYIPNGTLYWIFTACLNRLMFAGGYGSRWSFSKCGHIWKRRCCFAKRGSLATCPTAVGESTRSKGTGVFWEIEILTAFPFFFHSKLIREGKTETFTATLRLLMGCLYSWMNEAVMILNATCWCTMGSNHKAFSNLRSYSWWTRMWLTSISSNISQLVQGFCHQQYQTRWFKVGNSGCFVLIRNRLLSNIKYISTVFFLTESDSFWHKNHQALSVECCLSACAPLQPTNRSSATHQFESSSSQLAAICRCKQIRSCYVRWLLDFFSSDHPKCPMNPNRNCHWTLGCREAEVIKNYCRFRFQ